MNHFYSWTDNFSTDPTWSRNRSYHVLCGGKPCLSVMYCVTGEHGFVKAYRTDSVGRILDRGAAITYVGPVEVLPVGQADSKESPKEKIAETEVSDGITTPAA